MFHDIFKAVPKAAFYLAAIYALAACLYPLIVWWTWIVFSGLFGVYACLLVLWVSTMALDEIQIHWKLFQSKRRANARSCSNRKCNLD